MIHTKIVHIEPENIDEKKLQEAAETLRAGGIVAFPTETVYGLGANALDEEAVKKVFKAKGRPSDNPLIVHISEIEEIYDLVIEVSSKAKMLMKTFWPGPLTLLFQKSNKIPNRITAGLDTVAIRMPIHPVARKLIKLAEVPVAAPSANLSGRPSPTRPEHVIEDLKGKVDIIISGGNCSVGVESTVLDITGDVPIILRPGGITREQLEEVLGQVDADKALKGDTDQKPRSPGMKYTHYSPRGEVIIISGNLDDIVETIQKLQEEKEDLGLKVGIMATDETKERYKKGIVISMGSRKKSASIAANLFAVLRQFDEESADIIFAESIEEKSLGYAVMNRMLKAAGYNVICAGGEKN